VVTNSVITNNHASQDGGGVYMGEQASATLLNNTITGNVSGFGAGVYSYRVTNLTLQGNTISNNTANSVSPPADGGGLYVDASDAATHYILTLTSNTMVSNH
jgi:parallel beta-helix repeat protein